MSMEEKSLRNDVESYLRGEQPPPEVLATAPLMEQWAIAVGPAPDKTYEMTLIGVAQGHPWVADGKRATSGAVVWLDRLGRFARTWNTVWKLGEPEGREIPIDGVDL
jgi:hypothetical protein